MGKIIHNLPKHNLYVELFSGTKSRIFDKFPTTSEVYNDLNGDVTDLFEVIREDGKRFYSYINGGDKVDDGVKVDKWERLKSIIEDFKGGDKLRGDLNKITGYRPLSWEVRKELDSLDEGLSFLIGRLRAVQFENRRFDNIIERFDSVNAVFYVDVTVLPEDVEKAELVHELMKLRGKCIIYGASDEDDEYDYLIDEGWRRVEEKDDILWVNYRI